MRAKSSLENRHLALNFSPLLWYSPDLIAVEEDMGPTGSTQSGLKAELFRLFSIDHSVFMAVFRLVILNLLIIVVPNRRGLVMGNLAT